MFVGLAATYRIVDGWVMLRVSQIKAKGSMRMGAQIALYHGRKGIAGGKRRWGRNLSRELSSEVTRWLMEGSSLHAGRGGKQGQQGQRARNKPPEEERWD